LESAHRLRQENLLCFRRHAQAKHQVFSRVPHMKLFGKAQRAPAPKDAISKLRETLDMLQKREDYLQTKVQKELLVAKQNATKNKRSMFLPYIPCAVAHFDTAALAALKRKRAYESQIDKMQGIHYFSWLDTYAAFQEPELPLRHRLLQLRI
jgi:hypothetical protein